MTENISEIDALKEIDNLVGKLSDEERIRVFDFILSKYKIGKSNNFSPLKTKTLDLIDAEIPKDISIKEFINLKRPEGFYERIACLGYYLEKIQGMESFKTSDITEANKEARLNPMSNPTFFVGDATSKYGYLMPIGDGRKALSAKGEAMVEALPDREKVKQALENHPIRRKNVKKSAKLKTDEN